MRCVHGEAEVSGNNRHAQQATVLGRCETLLGQAVLLHEAHLVIDRQTGAGRRACGNHAIAFRERHAHWLFDHDVADATRRRVARQRAVRRRRRRDHDKIRNTASVQRL